MVRTSHDTNLIIGLAKMQLRLCGQMHWLAIGSDKIDIVSGFYHNVKFAAIANDQRPSGK